MSNNILWKSFNFCFSKFHCLPTITFSTPPTINGGGHDDDDREEQHNKFHPTTTLVRNFNSLYDANNSDTIFTSISLTNSSTTTGGGAAITTADEIFSSIDYESDIESIPDFTSAFASRRFFFSTPGSSNSIFQLPEALTPLPLPQQDTVVLRGGVAVQTYSPDPYVDFRKSMQEMIEAREIKSDIKADWEFLYELLLCYLTLNPNHTHKFIVGAFSDVIVSLLSPPAEENCRKFHHQTGRHRGNSDLSV